MGARRTGTQEWRPESYERSARFVSDLGLPVVDLLAPRAGERILDLGCGDGVLSAHLVALGAEVVGVDASPAFIDAATERGVDARLGRGESLSFGAEFDAVFSNAALHWMLEPDAVIDSVWRALKPGGRFVAEMGGKGNVGAIADALVAALNRRGVDGAALFPWYYPTAEEHRARLEARGFAVESMILFPRPTPLPGPLADWLGVFAQTFLGALPEAERPQAIAEVEAACAPQLRDAEGIWRADYVRLRFSARKPGAAV